MSNNDKTEQPIPPHEIQEMNIRARMWVNNHKGNPSLFDTYIQIAAAEYYALHSLPPSPVGEAGEQQKEFWYWFQTHFRSASENHDHAPTGEKASYWEGYMDAMAAVDEAAHENELPRADAPKGEAVVFAEWKDQNYINYQMQEGKYYHKRDLLKHIDEATVFTTSELYSIFAADRPNPSRAGEISPVLRWVRASERLPGSQWVVIRDSFNRMVIYGRKREGSDSWETNDKHAWWYEETEWLEEAPPTPAEPVKDTQQQKGFHCQLHIELSEGNPCKTQCDHCRQYYKPLDKFFPAAPDSQPVISEEIMQWIIAHPDASYVSIPGKYIGYEPLYWRGVMDMYRAGIIKSKPAQ